ncbi:hypothetical protein [Corynebacterium propinquum]|uniref:hypothetical protein n=1 Tax=Corynebacterium propinquum TaxID=43769 RepID=UPI0011CB2C95|nr:hypothetical protein [Corynebacterium propinquum]
MDFSKSEIDLLRQQHPDLADRISADMTSSDFLKLLTDVATQRDKARDRAGQEEKLIPISAQIPESLNQRLDRFKKQERVPKRVIITEALRDYLNEHEQLGN